MCARHLTGEFGEIESEKTMRRYGTHHFLQVYSVVLYSLFTHD